MVDTTYRIMLPRVALKLGDDVRPKAVFVETEKAPSVDSKKGLAAIKDGSTVAADQPLGITLASENRGLRQLELRTKPKIQTEPTVTDDKMYVWNIEGDTLPQGKTLNIEVYDTKNNESLFKRSLKIAPQPTVKNPVKRAYFTAGDKAIIGFSEPIEEASRKYIQFSLDGSGEWRDDKTYVFTPKTVKPGQTYAYMIKKGLRSKRGGIVTKTSSYYFRTTGAVSATASPYGHELPQSRQTIRFTFDQAVNRASVERRFSISAGKVVSKSWAGNTFSVVVTNLGFQRTVTATVGAGVKNSGFGLPSTKAYLARFTTEVRSKRLNVPYYAQAQSSTCTAAALRMALGYRGVSANEMELVRKMGYRPRDMDRSDSGNKWDDPAEMFVGYADGGSIYRGAGPDAPPVAKAAQASGRSATAVRGVSAQWVASQLYKGNPVIVFGATRNTGFETWKTPAGKTVRMNKTSHVVVVTGVKGEADNPLGFWVNDSLYGASYWTAGQMQANISRDAYRQAVVVY